MNAQPKAAKKNVSLALLLVALATISASALEIPDWRGTQGSTYQGWAFSSDNTTPAPDEVNNIYGTPLLQVNTPYDWIPEANNADGIWPLSGQLDIYIPNRQVEDEHKDIWLNLRWRPADLDDSPFMPDKPWIAVTPFESLHATMEDVVDIDGWHNTLYKIAIEPNPPEEWFTVKGDILVDHLVIDTRCVPEPATIAMLAFGGLALLSRKRISKV